MTIPLKSPQPPNAKGAKMARGDMNFIEFLQTFRRGELLNTGDDMLNELIDAMRATGGDGTMTISLPFKTNKAGQIEVNPTITVKKPRKAMGTGIYFASDDGRLSRRDPNQPDMIDELETRRDRDN